MNRNVDFFEITSHQSQIANEAQEGNALLGYSKAYSIMHYKVFLSLDIASILLTVDFLFFHANFLYTATMRFCLSIMAIPALLAIGDSSFGCSYAVYASDVPWGCAGSVGLAVD